MRVTTVMTVKTTACGESVARTRRPGSNGPSPAPRTIAAEARSDPTCFRPNGARSTTAAIPAVTVAPTAIPAPSLPTKQPGDVLCEQEQQARSDRENKAGKEDDSATVPVNDSPASSTSSSTGSPRRRHSFGFCRYCFSA